MGGLDRIHRAPGILTCFDVTATPFAPTGKKSGEETLFGWTLVLAVKGQDNQKQQTKREFLDEWVRTVNSYGGFGVWSADVSRYPSDIHEIFARHAITVPLGWGDSGTRRHPSQAKC